LGIDWPPAVISQPVSTVLGIAPSVYCSFEDIDEFRALVDEVRR
jgi:hypothetical protein